MRAVSHDPTCRLVLNLADGRTATAVDLQEIYLDASRVCYEQLAGDLSEAARIEAKDVFGRWQDCLDALRRDPMELADQLDWVAKLALMESYRSRDGLGWDSAKLALIDLQYCDVDPRRSLYAALVAKGKMRRLVTPEEVERARTAAAGGHPRLLPGPGHREVRLRGRRRVLGLGHLRRAGPSGAAAGAAARPAARHPASRSER